MYFTERQLKILQFLRNYILQHQISPTVEEIAAAFSITKGTAHEHIRALEKKRALRRSLNQTRSIELAADPRNDPRFEDLRFEADSTDPSQDPTRTDTSSAEPVSFPDWQETQAAPAALPELPILGSIQAGSPIEAVADRQELDIGAWLRADRDYFVLQVKGDSMIEDGIHEGDFVLVERRAIAQNGEVVVALLDGSDATLKRFYREGGRVRLQPANSAMQPIYRRDVLIQGVVIGLVRRF